MQEPEVTTPTHTYPAELLAACAACRADPSALLDWAVRKDTVVLILANGQKFSCTLAGSWAKPKKAR